MLQHSGQDALERQLHGVAFAGPRIVQQAFDQFLAVLRAPAVQVVFRILAVGVLVRARWVQDLPRHCGC